RSPALRRRVCIHIERGLRDLAGRRITNGRLDVEDRARHTGVVREQANRVLATRDAKGARLGRRASWHLQAPDVSAAGNLVGLAAGDDACTARQGPVGRARLKTPVRDAEITG